MMGIRRLSLFGACNSVVARVLGQAYEKMNEAVDENNFLDKSGGKKRLVFPPRLIKKIILINILGGGMSKKK